GTGLGAENGVLFKGGEHLEKARSLTAIILDKTGTITRGEPRLTDVMTLNGFSDQDVLRLTAAAESRSEHPLATAIVNGARERNVDLPAPTHFEAVTGKGIEATVDGHHVLVGTRRLLSENGIDPAPLQHMMEQLEREGKTAMAVSIDGQVAGVIA